MTRLPLLLVLLGGCYRLDALIEPTGAAIGLVGSVVARHTLTPDGGMLPLPSGTAAGDLILVSALSEQILPAAPPGWVIDDSFSTSCGGSITFAHRFAEASDTSAVVDFSALLGSDAGYTILIATYSGVTQLGGALQRKFDASAAGAAYSVALPPAKAGELAFAVVNDASGTGGTLSIAGGRVVGSADALSALEVALADPLPMTLDVSGHTGTCGVMRAQVLVPSP